MAIAPSPPLAATPVRKRRPIALTLLIAFVCLFGLDALLFRTRLYMSILEPDSSAGLLELILRREKAAQRTAGDNLVVTLGNSRMGFMPRIVDQRPQQTGYAFRTAGVAGSDPRSWYYLLRDLDPTARRYRAIDALKQMEGDELFSKKAEPAFYRLFHELVALPEVRTRFGWSWDKSAFVDMEKARQFFELICGDGKTEPKIKTFGDVRKLKSVVGHPKAEDSLFDTDQPLSEAIRIGEQGRRPVDASDLLDEAKASLAGIGVLQAQKLTKKDMVVIDELLNFLQQLKKSVPASKAT